MPLALLGVLVALAPPLVGLWLWRSLKEWTTHSRFRLVLLPVLGALGAVACWWLEQKVWLITGIAQSLPATRQSTMFAAQLAFVSPLEESAKLLLFWPLLRLGHFRHQADGVVAATFIAVGFASTEALLTDVSGVDLPVLRLALGAWAHLFFAGTWGFVLTDRERQHWLKRIWLLAVVLHGLFDHIVFHRGAGTLVTILPALLAMFVATWMGLRHLRRGIIVVDMSHAVQDTATRALGDLIRRSDRPLMLHWIVFGGAVTIGVVLSSVALAVYVGHELGVDFGTADEADLRSNGPLGLLGVAIMSAFPTAAYLVARASSARSVLEPAMGAAAALAAVVALLSVTAPATAVFALAIAPVAFGLSCIGAWFGLSRS